MAGGSFAPLGDVRDRAQHARDERVAAEKKAAEDAKKAAAAAAEAKDKDKAPAAPPPIVHVSDLHGPLTEDELLAKYPDIVEQVKQKNYMLQGYTTHDIKIGSSTITVRTLRKNEQRVASLLAEGELSEDGRQVYHPEDLNKWSLVFAITRVGQQQYDPIVVPNVGAAKRFVADTNTKLAALAESDDVKKRLVVLDNWSVAVFHVVLATFVDISAAYGFAIMRDMKNP